MTLKSSAGANLRPYGVLRDRDGLRMLAKVPAFSLPCFPCLSCFGDHSCEGFLSKVQVRYLSLSSNPAWHLLMLWRDLLHAPEHERITFFPALLHSVNALVLQP